MKEVTRSAAACLLAVLGVVTVRAQSTRAAANTALLRDLQLVHGLTPEQMDKIQVIFARSSSIGQGNPAVTRHPVSVEQCEAKLTGCGIPNRDAAFCPDVAR